MKRATTCTSLFAALAISVTFCFNEPNQFPIPVAMHHQGVIYLSRGYRT